MTIDGQTVTSPQVLNWAPGSKHTVAAANQNSGSIRYMFARWSDGGGPSHDIAADPAVTFYILDFVQQVPVSVGVAGNVGGVVSLDVASPDGYFASQTVFTMTATPTPGYTFQHWSGGTSCPRVNAASPTSFVVGTTAISCLATFTQSPVTTIGTNPSTLPVTVDGISYLTTPVNVIWAPGTTHTIATAPPASNPTSAVRYIFKSGAMAAQLSHSVTAASGSATFTATFGTQYTLVLPVFQSCSCNCCCLSCFCRRLLRRCRYATPGHRKARRRADFHSMDSRPCRTS